MLQFSTAGESHGPALIAVLGGIPAGLPVSVEKINEELSRRQQGYGRSSRQKIESDKAEITGGIRHGITSGAPVAVLIRNRDWENWKHVMSAEPPGDLSEDAARQLKDKSIATFRPGHADLPGTLKYRQRDIRDVLERSSARETAARVAVGAICSELLEQFGITLASHVIQVGPVKSKCVPDSMGLDELERLIAGSELFCTDAAAEESMIALIKTAWQQGDSLGGAVEILADGLPIGLGTYTQWDTRLDGQLAQALMSIQAIKAVEIGEGFESAGKTGSQVHDPILPVFGGGEFALPFRRSSNRAGGLEGGMTNGERLKLRAYMKPLPTMRKGLPSVSYPDFAPGMAHFERSDVCAIAAASVVCKAMVSFVLARALIDKFGGDTLEDMRFSYNEYLRHCRKPAAVRELPEDTQPQPDSTGGHACLEAESE